MLQKYGVYFYAGQKSANEAVSVGGLVEGGVSEARKNPKYHPRWIGYTVF